MTIYRSTNGTIEDEQDKKRKRAIKEEKEKKIKSMRNYLVSSYLCVPIAVETFWSPKKNEILDKNSAL